jgi:hypothetical protein
MLGATPALEAKKRDVRRLKSSFGHIAEGSNQPPDVVHSPGGIDEGAF